MAVVVAIEFPSDTDNAAARQPKSAQAAYYEAAYQPNSTGKRGLDYEKTAELAANTFGIEKLVAGFVQRYGLTNKRVLEVGSGRGYLQDQVDNYTGLDLSPSVATHYHKPFVVGSATDMPFPDGSFDAIWTVWVMEHIPQPERAFVEMRRVLKPGGLVFLYVAWNCTPWAADGFQVRPYGDFNWRGKLVKASIPVRTSSPYLLAHFFPIRALRWMEYSVRGAATPLRFRAMEPNYETYWQPDSDAAISLDSFEALLWFQSRGDKCLNCASNLSEFSKFQNPLILRVKKKS